MPIETNEHSTIRVAAEFQPLFREIGFDGQTVFTDPAIKPWRQLADRENCLWNVERADGTFIRLHVKRYAPAPGKMDPASREAAGFHLLESAAIPTAKLVAWGKFSDGRGYIIIEDLAEYSPADKLIESGVMFDRLLVPTARLAARLHDAGLHHRDLYLCHFFARRDGGNGDVRLIDVARVKRLPGFFLRNRWIIKDLAQFWYSTLELEISHAHRDAWLREYAAQRNLHHVDRLRRRIVRKCAAIARHDRSLRKNQPGRNISIPNA